MAARQITRKSREIQHANLKPFSSEHQPAKRGKRPPVSLNAILQRILEESVTVTDRATGKKLTLPQAELLVKSTLRDAISKDGPSRKQIWDRIEGQAVAIVQSDNTNHDDAVIVIHE